MVMIYTERMRRFVQTGIGELEHPSGTSGPSGIKILRIDMNDICAIDKDRRGDMRGGAIRREVIPATLEEVPIAYLRDRPTNIFQVKVNYWIGR